MGDTASNANIQIHRSAHLVPIKEVFVNHHFGNLNINTTSPAANIPNWKAYRDSVLNNAPDSKVHALGFTAWGSWYDVHVKNNAGFYGAVRGAIYDGCSA